MISHIIKIRKKKKEKRKKKKEKRKKYPRRGSNSRHPD